MAAGSPLAPWRERCPGGWPVTRWPGRASFLLVPSLPFFFRLPIKNGPRVGQLCQPRQMPETIDCRRGRVLREHGGVQPARPGDFPNCTPKTFRRRTTQIASRGTFEVVDVQPRSGFVTGDQFDRSEGAIP